jgi:glyoxylase-like metal-dependent hydrolase (beta-lactamase superfamily II)
MGLASRAVRVGDIEITPLSDGMVRLPQSFYVNLDFEAHADMLAEDGRVHVPIGCYLIRSGERVVLVDAGLGPIALDWAQGGDLPAALAEAGAAPGDIDTVLCTHLHIDHIGWLAQDGAPWFPNATVLFGSADWRQFVEEAAEGDQGAASMRALDAAGRLAPLDRDMAEVAPGLTARATPGHTLGHVSLVVSSGEERAFLLGDAVECPLQVAEADFWVMSDVDPAMAGRTREALWRELEGTPALVGAAHFPGLEFGRILRGQGRRWFA